MKKYSILVTVFFLFITANCFSDLLTDFPFDILGEFSITDTSPDTDGDGLTDFEELIWGTLVDDPDTDDDLLLDGEEIYVYSTNPLNPFSDEDSIRDGVEVLLFGTDPSKWSTDGDQYSDGLELLGNSFACINDPPEGMGSVQSPGDNVFVAAYPVIDIEIDSNISVEEIPIITFGTEIWEEESKGYSVANTQGSSYSVGTENTHTIGGWKDTSNEEADAELWGEYQEDISSTETGYTSGWNLGTYGEIEVGTEVGGSVGFPSGGSVDVSSHVNVTVGVEAGVHADTYKGTTNSIGSGGEHSTQKIRSTSSSRGEKQESSFSTSITRTSYHETTVTNTNEIANGQKWAEATTIDTGNAGKLRFRFWIKNTGSDIANEINDLRFNIKIGDNLPITYPPINESGFSMQNLNPNSQIELGADIQITLDELEAIDMGQPIKISIADYSYGADEIYFMSAWGEDILVEIDDGVADGDESIDYYMTYVNFGETYLDVLKRLNTETQIGNPANSRTEIELTIKDNFITSIVGNPVTEWSWWNIYSQEDVNDSTPIKFEDQLASKQTRLQLVYYKDSDHDYYTDRTELKIGTDPQDINDHPSPILIVGKIIEDQGDCNSIQLKFTNAGNYDAYGIEAILYSPDSTTVIDPNQLIGGGGRVGVGTTFTPDETLTCTEDVNDCNEPVVLVRYNDPQGSHTFITTLDISDDPNQNIENMADKMLESELMVTQYTHKTDVWHVIDYLNPGSFIFNANVAIYYQDANGVIIDSENIIVDLLPGYSSYFFHWNPSDFLALSTTGRDLKAVIIITDYQGVEIDYDVQKFVYNPTGANLNDDGIVNFLDFSLLAQDYNETGDFLLGNIDGGSVVDLNDMLLLSDQWLEEYTASLNLYVASTDGGRIIVPGEGGFSYAPGTTVPIVAEVDSNTVNFIGWTGDLVENGCVTDPNSISTTVTLNTSGIVRANFINTKLMVSSSEGGFVSKPGEGEFNYSPYTIVYVEAQSGDYSIFAQWSGTAVDNGKVADPYDSTTTVLVDGSYTLYAEFVDSIVTWVHIADDPGVEGHEGFNGYMGKYEITNDQYCQYLNAALASGDIYVDANKVYGRSGEYANKIYFNTYAAYSDSQIVFDGSSFAVRNCRNRHPVIHVSWYGATSFANYYGWRLPTEWEWQAVADYDGSFTYGCGTSIDHSKANYNRENPLGLSIPPFTTEIVYYPAYGYGMNDMAGNVWEWTSTFVGNHRVVRGGDWNDYDSNCMVSSRTIYDPYYSNILIGFRVCH